MPFITNLPYSLWFEFFVEFEESDVRCVGETNCAACLAGAPNCSWCKQQVH